ncbi:MAG: arginine--tRNA ligase [Patescibacteria group bacterium]
MYTLNAIRANLARLISDEIKGEIKPDELVIPPDAAKGDLAYACFRLAKEQKTPPNELAKTIAEKIRHGDQSIDAVEADGGYVNIKLQQTSLLHRLFLEIEQMGDEYGRSELGKKREIMLEYANLNTHKEFHVGHLRNILYGLSLNYILDFAGWKTIPVSYINDMGANVAKCLWLLVRQGAKNIPEDKSKKAKDWSEYVLNNLTKEWVDIILEKIPAENHTGKYLGEVYAEATKLVEENEEWKQELSYVLSKLESHDKAWNFLWQETRRWSIQELYRYLQDFGVVLKRQYLESEFIDESKAIVQKLLEDGIAMHSEGAVIIDLDAYPDPEIQKQKLGVCILQKSDGNLLYATKDIPLAQKKFEEHPKMAESLLVVDTRQSHYFRQLFAILKIMGYNIPLRHLGYEFVTLPEGAMSSRKGTVIAFQDFIGRAVELAQKEVVSRHNDWNEGKIEHSAWCIAMGGIAFTILKQDPEKIIIFDLNKALAFEGDTGPYVQYSVTRLNSILDKAGLDVKEFQKGDAAHCSHETEKRLAMWMARFPEVCARAAEDCKPSHIATWCLEMASAVNAFYRDVPVIDAKAEEILARLRLVASAKQVLSNGLSLLGVPIPDAM